MSEIELDNEQQGFESMDLDPRIMRSLGKMGFKQPTLVQAKVIPLAFQGKDILARARTGSGKTAAYIIPIVQKILAQKVESSFQSFHNSCVECRWKSWY